MKLIIISLMLVSTLVFAQAEPVDAVAMPNSVEDKNADVKGSIAEPTHEQKKHIHDAAKKVKKKKAVKKLKANKKDKKKSVK
ncbi:MAG: hypothetical protein ABL930_00770 [Pseudobdellovibrio sp.]